MKHKIVTPTELPDYENKPMYGDMKMYLAATSMLAPHIMESKLPSCLVFYQAEDSLQAVTVCVSSHEDEMLSFDELVEKANADEIYVVYKNRMPSPTFSPRGAPIPDPSKCYRFKKVPGTQDFSS